MRDLIGRVVVMAAVAVLSLGAACGGRSSGRTDTETVTLAIESLFESETVGDRTASPGEVFAVVRLTIRNGTANAVIVEAPFFELELDDGRRIDAFTIAGDDEACAGGRVVKDELLTCNLAFLIDEAASPSVLRYRRDDVVLQASTALPSLARCFIFEDTLDDGCFEMCAIETCFDEDDDVESSCDQACLLTCSDDDDPCTCAAAGCGPGCDGALRAYDSCAAPCLVLCSP